MTMRRKAVSWVLGLGVAVATITTGTVYLVNDASQAGPALSAEEMRSVLVPLNEQPESRFSFGPMTFEQAAAEGALSTPEGMKFDPASCANYLEVVFGPVGQVDGWVQYGSRDHSTHNDNYVQAVISVPDGADQALIDEIRAVLSTCATGTVTLDGGVTGVASHTERAPLNLPGAVTYGTTWQTTFSEEPGTAGYETVLRYQVPPSAQLLVDTEQQCVVEANFVGYGDVFLWVYEPELAYANELTETMYQRVVDFTG